MSLQFDARAATRRARPLAVEFGIVVGVPAVAYASYLLAIRAVVVGFEAGMQSW